MIEVLVAGLVAGVVSYRLWRFVAQDEITQPVRDRLNMDSKFAYMILCNWCLGSTLSFAVTAVMWLTMGVAYPLLVAGIASVTVGAIGDRL